MKTKPAKSAAARFSRAARAETIASYISGLEAGDAAICRVLRKEIDASLPKATSKIWHAIPVWFVGECPVVGFSLAAKQVNLLFWNGQSFDEPLLKAAGKFKAAQIKFGDVAEIDVKLLRRWLKKAGTDVWDYRDLRHGS
jgi:hypothetical protein